MLVVISDLHFTDGTAGEHNLPVSAFKNVFLADIVSLAKDNGAKEIKLLLLGDIVDLIRSEQWFSKDGQTFPVDERPWGSNGIADVTNPRTNGATEERCLDILGSADDSILNDPEADPPAALPKDTILYKNLETFKLFRKLGSFFNGITVETIYIPGNHDRLCNLYPSLRRWLQKVLNLSIKSDHIEWEAEDNTQWRFLYEYMDEAYGVYARHGQQYDTWNFADPDNLSFQGHLRVPIGDVLTTEFAAKIPWRLASLRNDFMDIPGDEFDRLVENVKDIDNVRPLSSVMEWIYYRLKREDNGKVREAMNRTFKEVIDDLLDLKLVQNWRSPKTHWDEVLRSLSSPWLNWLSKDIIDRLNSEDILPLIMGMTGDSSSPEKDPLVQAAYNERVWRENKDIKCILYGHTHSPLQIALDNDGEHEVMYLNTGTWRNRISKTIALDRVPDFIGSKQITYTIFYNADEDKGGKKPGTVSFDVWTGFKKKDYE
ncbi:MAG: hypothetical protein PH343_08965 [Nitrospira sp.]|nr:hypothetical protein [Nitrospira sp.]